MGNRSGLKRPSPSPATQQKKSNRHRIKLARISSDPKATKGQSTDRRGTAKSFKNTGSRQNIPSGTRAGAHSRTTSPLPTRPVQDSPHSPNSTQSQQPFSPTPLKRNCSNPSSRSPSPPANIPIRQVRTQGTPLKENSFNSSSPSPSPHLNITRRKVHTQAVKRKRTTAYSSEDDEIQPQPTLPNRRGSFSRKPVECSTCVTLMTQNNDLKHKVKELTQMKTTLLQTNEILLKDNKKQEKKISSLEQVKSQLISQVSKSTRGTGKTASKSKAIQAALLPEEEQVTFNEAALLIEQHLFDDITESTINDAGLRYHDWGLDNVQSTRIRYLNGSSANYGNGDPMIRLKDSHGAVPVCPIERSRAGSFYTSSFATNEMFLRSMVEGAASEDGDKINKETQVKLEEMLMPVYNEKKRQMLSDLKKKVRCRYLTALGYSALGRLSCIASESSRREEERIVLSSKLTRYIGGSLDLSLWRKVPFSELKYSDDIKEPEGFVADELFTNSAAYDAFVTMRGYQLNGDAVQSETSILSLARADAWISVSMDLMKEKRKQGGMTGRMYSQQFEKQLPRATEELLTFCRNIISEKYPDECSLITADIHNPFLLTRSRTKVFRMPNSKDIYLAARSSTFKSQISRRLGRVIDGYIGRARDNDKKFRGLTVKDISEDLDTSDEEDKEVAKQEENSSEDEQPTEELDIEE